MSAIDLAGDLNASSAKLLMVVHKVRTSAFFDLLTISRMRNFCCFGHPSDDFAQKSGNSNGGKAPNCSIGAFLLMIADGYHGSRKKHESRRKEDAIGSGLQG
jgi:hypothetical protein